MIVKTYMPMTHKYYEELTTLLVSLASLNVATTCYANNGVAEVPKNKNNAFCDSVKSKYGTNQKTWPDIWRFAWLVRNAIAHGDMFSINDQSFPMTSWKGITVSPAKSGQRWFDADSGMLSGGDVLELLEDLNADV